MLGYTLPTPECPIDYCITPRPKRPYPSNSAFASGKCCKSWEKLIDCGLYKIHPFCNEIGEFFWAADVDDDPYSTGTSCLFEFCPFCGNPREYHRKKPTKCRGCYVGGETPFASGLGIYIRPEDEWVCRKDRNLTDPCHSKKIIFKFCPACGGRCR